MKRIRSNEKGTAQCDGFIPSRRLDDDYLGCTIPVCQWAEKRFGQLPSAGDGRASQKFRLGPRERTHSRRTKSKRNSRVDVLNLKSGGTSILLVSFNFQGQLRIVYDTFSLSCHSDFMAENDTESECAKWECLGYIVSSIRTVGRTIINGRKSETSSRRPAPPPIVT